MWIELNFRILCDREFNSQQWGPFIQRNEAISWILANLEPSFSFWCARSGFQWLLFSIFGDARKVVYKRWCRRTGFNWSQYMQIRRIPLEWNKKTSIFGNCEMARNHAHLDVLLLKHFNRDIIKCDVLS